MNIELAAITPANPAAGARWIDSHVHLDAFDQAGRALEILDRARHAGVHDVVAIGGSVEANERAVRYAVDRPDQVHAVIGYDRDIAGEGYDVELLRQLLAKHPDRIVGIGESGLDYHYEPDSAAQQKKLFGDMLDLAAEVKRPIVVHSRDADADTLDMLRHYVRAWPGDAAFPGVLHCFTGSYAFARKLLDLGMLISFSGIVTFRNAADLREVARQLPLDRILIETDAPYLAPVPHRGKTNEPAWVTVVGETLATFRPDEIQVVASVTTGTTRALFNLEKTLS